jgi:hypothetical protein
MLPGGGSVWGDICERASSCRWILNLDPYGAYWQDACAFVGRETHRPVWRALCRCPSGVGAFSIAGAVHV